MSRKHWRERVTYTNDRHLLGEDEQGDLFAPSRTIPGWWDRRFSWKKPTLWRYGLRSRLTRTLVYLSWDPEATDG